MPVYFGSNKLKLDGISKAYYGSQLVYSSSDAGTYLTFSSTQSFSLAQKSNLKTWDGMLEYSKDLETWYTWDGTSIFSGIDNKLYLRGVNNHHISTHNSGNRQGFTCTGSIINVYGNIENLLDYHIVAQGNHPPMDNYCYEDLFNNTGNIQITSALILPATTLSEGCYASMFSNCGNLLEAPILPATTLAKYCYYQMFYGCRLLTTAPILPATALANNCYSVMFMNCTSLVTAPSLPATVAFAGCYSSMFMNCTLLETAPELPATTLYSACYNGMFSGCTSLTTIPELSATALVDYCYYDMFRDCTGIKLSTTQDSTYINEYRIPITGIGTDANNALTDMFFGTGGSFTGTPSINTTYYTSNTIIS